MILQKTLEEYFKWFHRHPELGNEEKETTAHIRDILTAAGVEILDTSLKTGLVAQISGTKSDSQSKSQNGQQKTPVVALRCDIDALPIDEASGVAYASENPHCMHACGHDFHITSMLGAALLLTQEKENLTGTIKLLFQPAEEGGGGAKQVLDSGVLDDVEEIYGLHVAADLEKNVIAVRPGATHAAVGSFKIVIRGKGSHAAYPHLSNDPLVASAAIITAAQTIVSRNTSPFEQAVVSITHVEGGSAWNVIPSEVLIEGTFRAFSEEKLNYLSERLAQICEGIGISYGLQVDYAWKRYTIATNNDPALAEFAAQTARDLGLTVIEGEPGMGGEDFALYQQKIKGVFWNIGVASPNGLHHPGFVANLEPLSTAAGLLARLGKGALERLAD
ncbi:MAG: amidohydrolase [Treponema sp.]|jgi:amidohydrolase|nr:amidohydrolase [Treponema sp.]